tara:strand:- start:284 stop:517 length:234 start_codon:yes stop_codon:yes gene_type:complete
MPKKTKKQKQSTTAKQRKVPKEKKIDLSSHYVPNTGQAKYITSYVKPNDLKVEETLDKEKEVHEKDVFNFPTNKVKK